MRISIEKNPFSSILFYAGTVENLASHEALDEFLSETTARDYEFTLTLTRDSNSDGDGYEISFLDDLPKGVNQEKLERQIVETFQTREA